MPQHPFAYNNLAFIYNMHGYHKEAAIVCQTAKVRFPKEVNHNCYRHWAYALFKENNKSGKAFKKINKAVKEDPLDAETWILWGMMLRSVGNYEQAVHKIKIALDLDPENKTAIYENELLKEMVHVDSQLELSQGPYLRLMKAKETGERGY